MSRTTSLSHDAVPSQAISYFVGTLLIVLVLFLAWLQFQWLTQLKEQEEARRRVALGVAGTNLAEYAAREMNLLLGRAAEAASLSDLLASEPLIDVVVAFDADGSARIRTRDRDSWLPARWSEVLQRLGRPLILLLGDGQADTGLWLKPAVLVVCRDTCEAGVLARAELVDRLIEPAASRMFADFGDELDVIVTIDAPRSDAVLYASDAGLRDFDVTDLDENLLPGVPVLGPPDTEWRVKVNHAGSSLEAAVFRSHLQNVLLSVGVLSLLVVSIGLVVSNARRQSALAREQLYFVAAVSHELRTPLTVISTAAENLADDTIDDVEQTRNYGQLIHAEVRKLGTMIENVLQFAQSASSARPRIRSTVNIADLVTDVIEDNSRLLEAHELQLDIPETLPPVIGDAAALRSVLANLLVNAARYSEGDHWIAIRATTVRVRPRGRALRINISNPVGRLDADPDRYFEPFYRGARVRDRGQPGTGIGLAVARHVARQHGGGIRIDAARAGMITFSLFLPIDENASPPHSSG